MAAYFLLKIVEGGMLRNSKSFLITFVFEIFMSGIILLLFKD